MNLNNLDNLVKTGQLKKETYDASEFAGLLQAGEARLLDAQRTDLAIESRFDLAYNASHSLALAALRSHGYRPQNKSGHRYIVFQAIVHTAGLSADVGRILDQCHNKRNLAEYEGFLDISQQLLADLLTATEKLLEKVKHFTNGNTADG